MTFQLTCQRSLISLCLKALDYSQGKSYYQRLQNHQKVTFIMLDTFLGILTRDGHEYVNHCGIVYTIASSNRLSFVEPQINIEIVQQLAEMGFPWEACRKAVHFTGNTGSESAMNWVMEHMGDADFADPLVLEDKKSSKFFTRNLFWGCDVLLREDNYIHCTSVKFDVFLLKMCSEYVQLYLMFHCRW